SRSASMPGQQFRRPGKNHVEQPEERAHHDGKAEHQRGRDPGLLLGGPEHLAQLAARILDEAPERAAARGREEHHAAGNQAGNHHAPAHPQGMGGKHVVAGHASGHEDGRYPQRRGARAAFLLPYLFVHVSVTRWQARRESNPQPAVLETAALPIELLACTSNPYFRIFETTPAPTVLPPSRMAKRSPASIAIGAISSTVICTLSPGITISTPSGSSIVPVTSVVRK